MDQAWLDELSELLRIPSVSADPMQAAQVREAGEWVRDFVIRGGGEAELRDTDSQPLVVGEIRASGDNGDAPTILVYGHFDVQPPAPLELWDSEPFERAADLLTKEALREALENLSYRERRVLELRYGLGGEHPRTLDEVGRTFNVTRERIRQIENQSLKKLQSLAEAQKLREVA